LGVGEIQQVLRDQGFSFGKLMAASKRWTKPAWARVLAEHEHWRGDGEDGLWHFRTSMRDFHRREVVIFTVTDPSRSGWQESQSGPWVNAWWSPFSNGQVFLVTRSGKVVELKFWRRRALGHMQKIEAELTELQEKFIRRGFELEPVETRDKTAINFWMRVLEKREDEDLENGLSSFLMPARMAASSEKENSFVVFTLQSSRLSIVKWGKVREIETPARVREHFFHDFDFQLGPVFRMRNGRVTAIELPDLERPNP
jgi:hypothetical protein